MRRARRRGAAGGTVAPRVSSAFARPRAPAARRRQPLDDRRPGRRAGGRSAGSRARGRHGDATATASAPRARRASAAPRRRDRRPRGSRREARRGRAAPRASRRRAASSELAAASDAQRRARGSVDYALIERLPQSLERPVRARLDRPARHAEHRGGLLLRELEQVAARDHVAVVVAQRLDRRQQPLAPLGGEEGRLGRRSRVPGAVLRAGAERERRRAGRPSGGGCAPRWRRSRAARAGTARPRGSARARARP